MLLEANFSLVLFREFHGYRDFGESFRDLEDCDIDFPTLILFTLGNELHFEGNTIKTIIKSQFEDNFIFKRKINLIDGEVS